MSRKGLDSAREVVLYGHLLERKRYSKPRLRFDSVASLTVSAHGTLMHTPRA
jgi:hypothetical protein